MPLSSQSPLKQQQHTARGQNTVVQQYLAPNGGSVTGAPGQMEAPGRGQAASGTQSLQGGVVAPQGLGGPASTIPNPVISPAPHSGQFRLGAPGGQQASSKASVIQLTGLGIMSQRL